MDTRKRVAIVAVEDPELTKARLAASRATALVELVAPPEFAASLGESASWTDPRQCDRVAGGFWYSAGSAAFAALLKLEVEEVRFVAKGGVGHIATTEARLGAWPNPPEIVIELQPGDELPARLANAGAGTEPRLSEEAARLSLRDANRVEGPPEVRAALERRGWTLAQERGPVTSGAARVCAVVTCYNLSAFLAECLDSLARQTHPVDVIVVDDGSRPQEAERIAQIVDGRPRTTLLRQTNGGVSAARNAGINAADHEFVLIVDADNVLRPHLVERMVRALRVRRDASWVTCSFAMFQDGSREFRGVFGPLEGPPAALLVENIAGDACALHRREKLLEVGGFLAPRGITDDWDLNLTYLERGHALATVPEILFDYRVRGDSMSRTMDHFAQSHLLASRHRELLARHLDEAIALAAACRHQDAANARREGAESVAPEVDRLNRLLQARDAELRAQAHQLNTLTDAARQGESEIAALRRDLEQQRARAEALELSFAGAQARGDRQAQEAQLLRDELQERADHDATAREGLLEELNRALRAEAAMRGQVSQALEESAKARRWAADLVGRLESTRS